ncbi:hypothetical protein [Actinomadura bangladeshensis]|uniref:Uncharacterized protein n=1 Tax=Actinomadura bangladeshensis TaxID=453573 RepID=A0A6L9QUG7_9ACTN|nr:hypothetical protein [Actinomadura bangladeshensis]NEA29167.1 hypothetical protein [Actinomadura bangladeshensis]
MSTAPPSPMTWLSQGTINGLAASVAEHEVAIERAHEELENHRKAAFQVMEVLHRHQGLAAEAKFLLTIAHGAAPIPSPGEIREVAGEEEGLGLAIGSIRMALPADASAAQFGHLAESMRALYAAAHVVALHADERARTGAPPPPLMPEPDVPVGVPRAFASLMGRQVRVDNADGTHETGLLSSVEGGQLTLLDEDGVPSAWPLLDEVLAVRAWPPGDEADAPDTERPDPGMPDAGLPDPGLPGPGPQDAVAQDGGAQDGGARDGDAPDAAVQQPPEHQTPQREPARAQSRAGGVVSLVRRSGRSKSAAGM